MCKQNKKLRLGRRSKPGLPENSSAKHLNYDQAFDQVGGGRGSTLPNSSPKHGGRGSDACCPNRLDLRGVAEPRHGLGERILRARRRASALVLLDKVVAIQ